MILFQKNNKIILRVDYSPEITKQIKEIPGAVFDQWEWTFPVSSMSVAWKALNLKAGHLYPYLKEFAPKNPVPGTSAYYDHNKLILTGKNEHLDYLIDNLQVLCGYEEVGDEFVKGRGRVYNYLFHTLLQVNNVREGYVSVSYPQGLQHRVKTFLKWLNVSYREKPAKDLPRPVITFPGNPKYPARYYQEAIAKQAPLLRRAIIVKPTGSGKTRTAGEIIRQMGLPTLFLTDSKLLLNQTIKSLEETLNVPVGKVGEGHLKIRSVNVATVQTIRSILAGNDELDLAVIKQEIAATKALFQGVKIPANFQSKREAIIHMLAQTELLIVDEAHTLGADVIYSIAALPEPSLAFGLTATPQREDEHGILIEAATGPLWKPISEKELIEKGYLLPVKVWVVPFKHSREYKGPLRKMYELKLAGIVQNEKRNLLLKSIAEKFQSRYKTLLLVNEEEHAKTMATLLNTTFITGKSKSVKQEEAINALVNGEIQTLVATPLLEQGVDIPDAELLIDGTPRRSVRRIIQSAGRIRRPGPGKTCAYIVTILDLDNGMFEKQSMRKLHILKQAEFEITYAKPIA